MGWNAIDFCNDIWELVEKDIPIYKRQAVAKAIYKRFREEDMADIYGESRIEKVAKVNQMEVSE
jgi:hypothetical protein